MPQRRFIGPDPWPSFTEHVRKAELLSEIRALLEWDQLVTMPAGGAEGRALQSALLASLEHQGLVDPAFDELLSRLEEQGTDDPIRAAGLRNMRREHDRAVRVPASLVQAVEMARGRGHERWLAAREARNFELFRPALEEIVELSRTLAALHMEGPRARGERPMEHPYDALMEAYEPGARVHLLKPLFGRLEKELRRLLSALGPLAGCGETPDWPFDGVSEQRALCERVLRAMGFDLRAGRLDTAVHPFTSSLGPGDVRITTRFKEGVLLGGLGATLHEGGHGLYAQNLPNSLRGTGAGGPASLGLHESQSRYWENTIGSSLPFCKWIASILPPRPDARRWRAETLYAARNRVRPSPIRIEADEVTYNLHILIRFEMELALMERRLDVRDLEEAWNDAYESRLGLRPRDPVEGVLQDVHWAEGIFGYFPTYTLGNLYAASLGAAMSEELPMLWEDVAQGEFGTILQWMRERVHSKGHLHDASTIVELAAGKRDPVRDLMAYLWQRHGRLHSAVRPGKRALSRTPLPTPASLPADHPPHDDDPRPLVSYFVTSFIPEPQATRLAGLSARLGPGVELQEADRMHVTFRSFDGLPPGKLLPLKSALREVARRHEPFDAVIRGFGIFEGGAIYTSLESEALHRLQADIHQALTALGLPAPSHPFLAHVTLAHAQPGSTLPATLVEIEDRFRVDELFLTTTGTIEYRVVMRICLGVPEDDDAS